MAVTRVLIIDDEKENVRYLSTILEENGFTDIHSAFDGEEGLDKVRELSPGLILLDLRMPRKSGISVFNELKKTPEYSAIPVVILTGEGGFLKHLAELRDYREDGGDLDGVATEEVLGRFINSRPDAFIEKPVDPEAFMAAVSRILITLDEIQERLYGEVEAYRDQRLSGGFSYKDGLFESDESSLGLLSAMAAKVAGGGDLPGGFVWQTRDNREVAMDREEFLAFQGGLTDWVYETWRTAWKHLSAIGSLGSIEDAQGYDISKGWPDNRL